MFVPGNEEQRVFRAEGMLRAQVLTAWPHAINRRIESLGGKIDVT